MTNEFSNHLPETEQFRESIIKRLGETATREIHTASRQDILDALGPIGKRSDPRRRDLYSAIANLGGRSVSCVDLILHVETAVQDYRATTKHLVTDPVLYPLVPGYLKALIPAIDEKGREGLENATKAWDEFVAIKHGSSGSDTAITSSIDKTNPPKWQPRPRPNRKTRAQKIASQKRAKKQGSDSLNASRKAHEIDEANRNH